MAIAIYSLSLSKVIPAEERFSGAHKTCSLDRLQIQFANFEGGREYRQLAAGLSVISTPSGASESPPTPHALENDRNNLDSDRGDKEGTE